VSERARFILALFLAAALSSCGDGGPVKRSWGKMKGLDRVVGNMNDDSYSTGRTQAARLNAEGNPVHLTEFDGSFVWSEYAATWCAACAKQTAETKKVEHEYEDIVFLTVMTGRSNEYNDHATVETARHWARSFQLDPSRVIAAELWYKTVPEHRFYSPQGHTLFVHVGYLSSQQIREVIDYYRTGWVRWAETGEKARWMHWK